MYIYIYTHLCLHIHVYIYIYSRYIILFRFFPIFRYLAVCLVFYLPYLEAQWEFTAQNHSLLEYLPSCWISQSLLLNYLYIYIYINFGALWKHYEKHEDIITSVFCLITFIYNDIHTFITFYTYVIYIYIYQKTILLFLSILYHRLASHLVLMTCEFSAAGWPSITRSTPRMRSRFTPAIGRYRANMLWWWNQFEWDLDGT